MSKQFLGVIVAIIVIFFGVYYFSSHGTKTASTSNSSASSAKPSDHVEGQGSTGVTLVEFGDYECPFCGEYYPTVKAIVKQYFSQITFQFVNFPLVTIHPNAFAGARAAEAASMMGQFWQMHDLLYQNQNQWVSASNPLPYFMLYAKSLGLNTNTFVKDYNSEAVNNVINADITKGNNLGIDATPTFYLDGKQIQPANSITAFQTLINAAIAKKTGK